MLRHQNARKLCRKLALQQHQRWPQLGILLPNKLPIPLEPRTRSVLRTFGPTDQALGHQLRGDLRPINLKGAAVIRVTFPDVTGKKDSEILVRAKIIAKGSSTWQGLILGGRALDAVERGGLGFRPGANSHIFDNLRVRLPRKEETEEYVDHAYPRVAVQKSLFELNFNLLPNF